MGYIYILTNPSFPDYVKIGYADDVEQRLQALNRSECTPYAFRVYATYEVSTRLTDMKIHGVIDKLNPTLRSIDNVNGKKRIREFYAMSAEDAYGIFEAIAEINGCETNLKLWEQTDKERDEEETAAEITYERREVKSPFSFEKCNIAPGSVIVFTCAGNPYNGEECTVIDNRHIEYDGKQWSMSALATLLTKSKNGVAGPRYFKYNGEWLNDIRNRCEDD